jgi:hypothetical protein
MAAKAIRLAATQMGPSPPTECESMNLLREPDAANPQVRFDERDVEAERITPPRHVSTLPNDPTDTQFVDSLSNIR